MSPYLRSRAPKPVAALIGHRHQVRTPLHRLLGAVLLGAVLLGAVLLGAPVTGQNVQVSAAGGLRQWHAVTLTLDGPKAAEGDTTNPFLSYRMDVTFRHVDTGLSYRVPGYFAADGNAANSSATSGTKWRAHLSPDHVGKWTYAVSFRTGTNVAIAQSPSAGKTLQPFDGVTGSFTVLPTDKTGRDHRGKGRLRYVGRHHLQFANGEFFLKAGADSPENLLAYNDIDNTPNNGGWRKTWAPHVKDWKNGDPTWQQGLGKGLIGALNYLSGKGMNAVSFLTYSHNGDDKNVFPYVAPKDRLRLDCSKLDQWEIVLAHADTVGLHLHFKTQETENDQDMDGGALGTERRLYYRELIARFAHHLALNWNLGEENTNTTAQLQAFASYFHALDPYHHPIVVHTFPSSKNSVYTPLLGSSSQLTGASLQSAPNLVFLDTKTWRANSAAAGRPWVVANDEQGPAGTGIMPDANDPNHDSVRKDVLWGNLMAGGAGIESYFGYQFAHSDLSCNDFRSRDRWWDQCRHALVFFRKNRVPFEDLANDDRLVSAGWCLAGPRHFVIYLGSGSAAPIRLDLTNRTGSFDVAWFDPRNGGSLQNGSVATVAAGGQRSLGTPPNSTSGDWVLLVRSATPSVTAYGKGCPGTGAKVPRLVAQGLPRLGNKSFGLQIQDGLPSAPAALFLAPSPGSAPLSGGCTFLVLQEVTVLLKTGTNGIASLPLAVPNDPKLLGMVAYAAGAVADGRGAWLGIAAFTGGLRIDLGR